VQRMVDRSQRVQKNLKQIWEMFPRTNLSNVKYERSMDAIDSSHKLFYSNNLVIENAKNII